MIKIDFTVTFANGRIPTMDELVDLKLAGVKHIEVWKQRQTVTVYDLEKPGWGINSKEEEKDFECSMTCVLEVPDNWPHPDYPFQEEQLGSELSTMLVPIFGEEDKTKTGEPMPEGQVWWLDDYDIYLQ